METPPDIVAPARQRFLSIGALHWNPQALQVPQVNSAFQQMDQVQRTAEVLRYSVLKLEFWISRRGNLREWVRWNLSIALVLGVPAMLIVPLVTYLLGQFATWSALLVQIVKNLMISPVTGIVGVALLSATILLMRLIIRR